jgi:putative nucleotidyltransferase with HDIG domain
MSGITLEDAVGEVLHASRDALGVSRARCYAMNPSGSFRLAASYGFVSRFGPEDALESGHPLIEWVQRHRRPSFVNSPRDAGLFGEMMQREHYARSLTVPVYQGSRLVGILELQDKLGGSPFGVEDSRRVDAVVQKIEGILVHFNGTSVAEPEPMAEEDREALFLDPHPEATEFPPPPDLFSADEDVETSPLAGPGIAPVGPPAPASGPRLVGPPELSRRETLVFKGFANALLLNPEIDAVVFSLWARERAEVHVAARRPFTAAGQEALLRSLESALRSAVPGVPVPRERALHVEYPLGRAPGEMDEPEGVQTSVIFAGQSTLLLSLVFPRPPVVTSDAALTETHRLVRAAVLQVRGAERYRHSYRSLVHFLVEPDRRAFPQLKAHSLAVGAHCRRLATALRLPAETVEQFTVAGLLHDIGLKDIDLAYDRIAGRRPLDLQELGLVRQHAAVGASLLSRIDFPYSIAPLVRHHHERFDGAGYPDRLAGDRIPLGSRIIGIVEAYDAMVSPHSYRAPISEDAALEIILLKGGTQFDPELARKFSDLVHSSSRAEEETFPQNQP